MTKHEAEAARRGVDALNVALRSLGKLPVGENQQVRSAPPVVGDIPNAVVVDAGVAPIRFVFGRELDVWVGPFSEVAAVEVRDDNGDEVSKLIAQVLRSEVTVDPQKRSVHIVLAVPGHKPWRRLTVRGTSVHVVHAARYQPYAPS